jgi:hypothetical protein
MKLTARVSVCALTALTAALLGSVACNDSTSTAANTGGAVSTNKGGATSTTGSGGATDTGSGGATDTGSGGATTAPGSGGATTVPGTGGTSTAAGGTSTAAGGTSTAAGGASPGTCNYPTASNPPPNGGAVCTTEAKGATCTTEGAVCWKACGPTNSSGWKTETCTGGVIVEVSACQWTGTDYSAFKIPSLSALDSSCPATAPQAAQPCTAVPCAVCADPATGAYLDSSGASKSGWCTCVGATTTKWTCGTSGTAWPCPAGAGC